MPPIGYHLGYHPDRITELSRRTLAAIDSASRVTSSDPAAAEAMRAIRLLRRNLEDQWMPAIHEIERSLAMVTWIPSHLSRGGHGMRDDTQQRSATTVTSRVERRRTRYSNLSDVELLDRAASRTPDLMQPNASGNVSLTELSLELALRVQYDDEFADRLVAIAPVTPAIALASRHASFPGWFRGAVLTTMLRAPSWFDGIAAATDTAAMEAVMTSLLDEPGACLDVLLDTESLAVLATWPLLDDRVVQDFVVTALHGAVAENPARLGDGYSVIGALTTLTNGIADGGVEPGLARGVAVSLAGYIETLAPAIRQEGHYPVVVFADDVELELGTYDDLVDLFGALLRDPEAQVAIGTALGAYTIHVVAGLGGHLRDHSGLEHVAQFADLIGDATRAEQAELVMAAAEEEASIRRLGGAIGFGLGVGLSSTGAGALVRAGVAESVDALTDIVADASSQADSMPGLSIPAATYDLVTLATVTLVASDRTVRASLGVASIDDDEWAAIDDLLDDVSRANGSDERIRSILRLDHHIETSVPALGALLRDVRSTPGLQELSEARNAVGPD